MQTHLAENHDEIATARRLYPQARELHRHLRPLRPARAALAVRPLHPPCRAEAGAAVGDAVGRGVLPDLQPVHRQRPVRSGDAARPERGRCGSASPPTSAAAPAIRCCARRPRPTRCCSCARQNLPALDAFYLMTLGNARALSLEDRIGSLAPGHEADLVVLDAARHPGHGAPHGDDRGRSRRGAVRADDDGR